MTHPNRSIAKIKTDKGELILNALLTSILTDLVMFFNVGKTMNTQQIVELANFIKTDYYFIRPSELKYCFDNAKKGRYGQLYDRIDGSIIISWLDDYCAERLNTVIDEKVKENKNFTRESALSHPAIAEILKKAININPAEFKIEINTDTPKKVSSKADERIQGFLKEFDILYNNKPLGSKSKRFVDYNGKILDQDEFISFRLLEPIDPF